MLQAWPPGGSPPPSPPQPGQGGCAIISHSSSSTRDPFQEESWDFKSPSNNKGHRSDISWGGGGGEGGAACPVAPLSWQPGLKSHSWKELCGVCAVRVSVSMCTQSRSLLTSPPEQLADREAWLLIGHPPFPSPPQRHAGQPVGGTLSSHTVLWGPTKLDPPLCPFHLSLLLLIPPSGESLVSL